MLIQGTITNHAKNLNILKHRNFNIKTFFSEKSLVINFNSQSKFSTHIGDICKKAERKMNALSCYK